MNRFFFNTPNSLKKLNIRTILLKNTDNVVTYKFKNRAIHSNIKINETKRELLNVNFQCYTRIQDCMSRQQ
jgi:hypothetical protein